MANLIELVTEIPTKETTIKIDGEAYPLISAKRLTFGEISLMKHAQSFMETFGNKTEILEDEEYEKAGALVIRVLCKVIDAPAEILTKLSFEQQLEVMNAWNKEMEVKEEKTPDPLSESSERSSQSSSDSMEEAQAIG
jgi:hypothetical protein